jgi:hypothetical protein
LQKPGSTKHHQNNMSAREKAGDYYACKMILASAPRVTSELAVQVLEKWNRGGNGSWSESRLFFLTKINECVGW